MLRRLFVAAACAGGFGVMTSSAVGDVGAGTLGVPTDGTLKGSARYQLTFPLPAAWAQTYGEMGGTPARGTYQRILSLPDGVQCTIVLSGYGWVTSSRPMTRGDVLRAPGSHLVPAFRIRRRVHTKKRTWFLGRMGETDQGVALLRTPDDVATKPWTIVKFTLTHRTDRYGPRTNGVTPVLTPTTAQRRACHSSHAARKSVLAGALRAVRITRKPPAGELAFTRDEGTGAGASPAIYLIRGDASHLRRLTAGDDPAWRPDGQLIAFADAGRIATIDTNSGTVTTLTNGRTDVAPSWSPDGRQVVFARSDSVPQPEPAPGQPIAIGDGPSPYRPWVINADGTNPHPITPTGLGKTCPPAWSPTTNTIVSSLMGGAGAPDASPATTAAGCTRSRPTQATYVSSPAPARWCTGLAGHRTASTSSSAPVNALAR